MPVDVYFQKQQRGTLLAGFILEIHEFLSLRETNSVRKFRENLFAPQKSFREFKQKYLQIE